MATVKLRIGRSKLGVLFEGGYLREGVLNFGPQHLWHVAQNFPLWSNLGNFLNLKNGILNNTKNTFYLHTCFFYEHRVNPT